MPSRKFDVVIVGGGQASAQAAVMLRQFGFEGSIAIVGEESHPPYDRPPLSKEYFLGEKTFASMLLQSSEEWTAKRVELILGRRATAVSPSGRSLRLDDGVEIAFEHLIWAAGGAPRPLSCTGAELDGVHTVRNRDDVDALKAAAANVSRVLVIGGGYIGLEMAAALIKLDKRVTLVEAAPRLLARVAGREISDFYRREHAQRGVDLRLGRQVEHIVGETRATGVALDNGETIEADLIVVGIGIVPAIEPLAVAGANAGDGVRVDEYCRTSLPGIYAIGDCAEHRSKFAGGAWVRIESVQNANDQAITAARSICGQPQPYAATPWFWSNQYDLRLQTVGLSSGHDECIVRGNLEARSFSAVYLRDGRVIALDCVNNVRDYTHGRVLVTAGAAPPREQIRDPNVALKSLIA